MQSRSLEVLGARKVDAKSRDPGDFDRCFSQTIVEHVAATLAIIRYVVHVEARYVDSLHVIGTPEANERAGGFLEGEDGLTLDGLQHGPIRHRLPRHGARFDALEMSVDAKCAKEIRRPNQFIEDFMNLGFIEGRAELAKHRRAEIRHHGKGRLLIRARQSSTAVLAKLVNLAVERNEFAIEFIERSEAEIAMLEQLPDGFVTIVDTVNQRAHQRCLIQLTFLLTFAYEA